MTADAQTPMPDATAAHGDAQSLLGFTLQLLREFLATHALSLTAEALSNELAASPLAPDSAALWFDMQQRCRASLANSSISKRSIPAASTLEQLVAFFVAEPLAPPRAGGRFSLDVNTSAAGSPSIVTGPKTSAFDGGSAAKHKRALQLGGTAAAAFSLMDAFTQSRSPVTLPSHRRKPQPSVVPPSPSPSTAPSDPEATPSKPEVAPSEPSDRQEDANEGSTAAKQRKKKRRPPRAHRSPLPPPAYPSSPWGNSALHSNAHFAAGGPARVASGFDAPIRRGSEASGASSSLLEPAPALVRALDASLQRDLGAVRLVDRELRHLRLEKAHADRKSSIHTQSHGTDAYARALELERFGSAVRQECALCAFPFLACNLPHRVSFKCVMDVHDAWGYAPPDRSTAAKYRAPLCYDAVRVCRLCAPIVLQHATQGGHTNGKLSGSHSLGALSLPRHKIRTASTFSSDPYSLPPLFADDLMDERDALGFDWALGGGYASGNGGGGSTGLGGGGNGSGCLLESPAKTIVYANQTDATAFMSAKEWEIINPHRSSIRQVMEQTVRPSAGVDDK